MVYAKYMENGELVAVLTYDYDVEFDEGCGFSAITEEEYNILLEELKARMPKPDPNYISDRKALEIITGGEV